MNHGRVKPFKIHHCSRSYSDFLTACTFEKLFCFLACRCKRSTRSVWERSGDDELTSGEVLVVVELANQKLLSYVFGTVYFGFLKPVSCCLFSSLCFNEESNCDFWWITWSAHATREVLFRLHGNLCMELAFEMWAETTSSLRLLCYNLFGNHVRQNRSPLVSCFTHSLGVWKMKMRRWMPTFNDTCIAQNSLATGWR